MIEMTQPDIQAPEGAPGAARPASENLRRVLRGVIDVHIHTSPDIFPRRVTSLEAAIAAREAGMGAILLKSHSTDTAARAEIVRTVTGFPVYGGVALNYPVGGLNPYAVIESAKQGGRCVWMPTISARNFIAQSYMSPMLQAAVPAGARGLVASHKGRLLPDVLRILDSVAKYDLMLTGGHFAPHDILLIFQAAAARGITRLVVNHAEWDLMRLSQSDLSELVGLGAYVEITKVGSIETRAGVIRRVGVEHCFLATDAGPVGDPAPTDLLYGTITGLRRLGFTADELRHLSVDVPAYLLGLTTYVDV
jgi:Family of unknown function (DUF6282)